MLVVVVGLAQGASWSSSGASTATCTGPWQPVSPTLATGELTDAVHAPGIGYVVVGRGGAVVTSPDGQSWIPRWTGVPGDLLDVTWGNGLFVAVGAVVSVQDLTPLIATSPDGVTWTRRDRPEHRQLHARMVAVAWTGSAFVALSSDQKAWVSADGLSWPDDGVVMGGAARFDPEDLAWDGARLVAVGNGSVGSIAPVRGLVLASPDGTQWTWDYSFAEDDRWGLRVVAHDGTTVAITDRRVLTSTAPGQWTRATLDVESYPGDVLWTGSAFLVRRALQNGVSGNYLVTSPDGTTWTPIEGSSTLPKEIGRLGAGPGLLLALRTAGLFSSPDGRVWTAHATATVPPYLSATTWTGRDFVAVAGDVLLSSTDGLTWQARPEVNGTFLQAVVSGQDTVLALGATGEVWRRTTGDTWTRHSSGTTLALREAVWTGTLFLVIGFTGPYGQEAALLSSQDGTRWERLPGEPPAYLWKLAWSGSEILGLANGKLVRSSDGVVWDEVESLAAAAPLATTGLAANPHTVVLVGWGQMSDVVGCGYNLGRALVSHDLATWQSVDFPAYLESVTWDGKRFLAVGQCGLVVSSPDGEQWSTEMAMPWSSTLTSVASSGRAAVAAGGGVMVAQPQCTQVGTVRRRLSSPASGPAPASPTGGSAHGSESSDPLLNGM
jgi:hypothetical protein